MSFSEPSLEQQERIDRIADEFERAFRNGQEAHIESFLDLAPDLRQDLLIELIRLEIDLLVECGRPAIESDYLARFPEDVNSIARAFADSETIAATVNDVARRGPVGRGLHVECPHCQGPIELVPDAELESIRCPSCGSDFSLVTDASATKHASEVCRVDRFRLVERLGVGAFGSVWKAHDTTLDRTVAIKIPRKGQFDASQQRSFLREAQNAAQLSHPGIVPVFEVGRDGETLFIISEYVRGLTVADWLTGHRPTIRETAELCASRELPV